jgi:hypothetical protein
LHVATAGIDDEAGDAAASHIFGLRGLASSLLDERVILICTNVQIIRSSQRVIRSQPPVSGMPRLSKQPANSLPTHSASTTGKSIPNASPGRLNAPSGKFLVFAGECIATGSHGGPQHKFTAAKRGLLAEVA